jgi:hypothetical protein
MPDVACSSSERCASFYRTQVVCRVLTGMGGGEREATLRLLSLVFFCVNEKEIRTRGPVFVFRLHFTPVAVTPSPELNIYASSVLSVVGTYILFHLQITTNPQKCMTMQNRV